MALYINTNVGSLFTQRNLARASNGLDVSFKRLTTGYRINSAADDAAGLQITNRLSAQIAGLNQGNRNANDGISLTQSIEGALDEVSEMFKRVRVLALQASNGSNSGSDRLALQEEARALSEEANRIAKDTTFAGENVLDGSFEEVFQLGANALQTVSFSMKNISGDPANSMTLNNGFTLSGIAGIASNIAGQALSTMAEGISAIDGTANTGTFASRFVASSLSLSSQTNAQYVLAGMDAVIAVVDRKRNELGAMQNRFEAAIRSQAYMAENLSAARARMKDTDFAVETAQLTKNQILQQASTSILTQANQRPQVALSLLS